jgi:CheY-like chemotaxis protein
MGRVLVVEDEPTNMAILAAYMRKAGHQTEQASDGVEALEKLVRDNAFDVVVTDRRMPRMDGLELFRRAMADPRLRTIPFIMQTAATAPDEVVEGIQAGVYYYLTKPYHEETLITLVNAAAKQRSQIGALEDSASRQREFLANTFKQCEFEVRSLQECEEIALFLGDLFSDPEAAANGLYELILNGLEHGIARIGYEEKSHLLAASTWESELQRRLRDPARAAEAVRVFARKSEAGIQASIKDPGPGFNWSSFLEIDPSRATRPNGRGIAKANLLSFETLRFNPAGNEVTVTAGHATRAP